MNTVYLALGSNKGDRPGFLRKAVQNISAADKIVKISSVYETLPYGRKNQPDFLNAVLIIETKKNIMELFRFLKNIEVKTGRTASVKWGEREIDIDILFFNDEIIDNEILTVPHKGIAERDFVLVPLQEVTPDFLHPVLKKTPGELLKEVKEKNIISIFPEKIIQV